MDEKREGRKSRMARDAPETEVDLLSSAAVGLWLQDGWSRHWVWYETAGD